MAFALSEMLPVALPSVSAAITLAVSVRICILLSLVSVLGDSLPSFTS